MEQRIITPAERYAGLKDWIRENGCRKILLVCDGAFLRRKTLRGFFDAIDGFGAKTVLFCDFQSNPLYEDVQNGVRRFREETCDALIAVGGGSAIDVAKCIKLYAGLPGGGENGSWLTSASAPGSIPFLAMPTTAGTGSEATRYAVIYYEGRKQSVTCESIIPDAVLMDPSVLFTLPDYYKKATMCDALCHAIEAFWSVNSTKESIAFSKAAIRGITENMEGYLRNTENGCAGMLYAANMAGKAINIAQTTAGHAMCYKITSLFGAAHGHAVMLCNRVLFPWMIENTGLCIDPRGEAYLQNTLHAIGRALGGSDACSGAEKLNSIFEDLAFEIPAATAEQYKELSAGVNPIRLKNFPVRLQPEAIDVLYHTILR